MQLWFELRNQPIAQSTSRKHRGYASRRRHEMRRQERLQKALSPYAMVQGIIRGAMWQSSFRDRERAETVSLNSYPSVGVAKGDVLTQRDHSYVHPSLRRN
jgi:hypothetical protein